MITKNTKNNKDSEAYSFQSNDTFRVAVQKFIFPKLIVKAKAYYQMVNLDSINFEQPPAAIVTPYMVLVAPYRTMQTPATNFKAALPQPMGGASC